jgi:hypothetical protein
MDRLKTHLFHQPSNSFAVHLVAMLWEPFRYPGHTVKGRLGVLLINEPHQQEI